MGAACAVVRRAAEGEKTAARAVRRVPHGTKAPSTER